MREEMMSEPEQGQTIAGAYEAIVYFHGIGEQRRYAELGRLIDALDLYAREGRDPADETGKLRDITGRFDVGRSGGKSPDVGHAELNYVPHGVVGAGNEDPEAPHRRLFRVYEAYWAPETAKGVPATEVLWWVARNLTRPLRLVFTRWRTHTRLRKTSLDDLREQLGNERWQRLSQASWDFEGLDVRRDCPKGSFREFKKFLQKEPGVDNCFLLNAAKRWRRHVVASAMLYQFILLTVALAALLGVGALVVALMWALNAISGEQWLVDFLGDKAEASWPNAFAVAGTLLLQVVLRGFLTRTFGDVVFWASDRETDVRFEVRSKMIAVGTATLRQVLLDERCTRVVVVAHSLGTTVAYEALLELGKHNKARNREYPGGGPLPIDRIDQFITLGSPIDKLHYFVESHVGGGHRYNRLYEELHGDVGTEPFSSNKKPRIHWINLWSKADVISGPLTSPMSMEHTNIRPVDNVEVKTTTFPDPAMSHSGYFGNESSVRLMFDAIIRGRHTYRKPQRRTEVHGKSEFQIPNYDAEDVGDVGNDRWARPIQASAGVAIWLAALYWTSDWLALPSSLTSVIGWVAVLLTIALVGGAAVGRLCGLANELQPASEGQSAPGAPRVRS